MQPLIKRIEQKGGITASPSSYTRLVSRHSRCAAAVSWLFRPGQVSTPVHQCDHRLLYSREHNPYLYLEETHHKWTRRPRDTPWPYLKTGLSQSKQETLRCTRLPTPLQVSLPHCPSRTQASFLEFSSPERPEAATRLAGEMAGVCQHVVVARFSGSAVQSWEEPLKLDTHSLPQRVGKASKGRRNTLPDRRWM